MLWDMVSLWTQPLVLHFLSFSFEDNMVNADCVHKRMKVNYFDKALLKANVWYFQKFRQSKSN